MPRVNRLVITTVDEKGREHRYGVTSHPNDLRELNDVLQRPETIVDTEIGSLQSELRSLVQPSQAEKLTRLRKDMMRRELRRSRIIDMPSP